jgi:phosphoglycolate phosphatase-like HAD superfamily hydrolase
MKPAILFDIDGTLANVDHRREFVTSGKSDWESFNAGMGNDTPNYPIVSLYKTLWESENYDLILVSGRQEEFRELTERWLVGNEIPFSRLLMRPFKDYRPDEIIKEEILNQLRSEGHEVLFVVDDRKRVVDMWRQKGITCLQCDVGDF